MKKLYLKTPGNDERINVDVYEPQTAGSRASDDPKPALLVVSGGGGKDTCTGSPLIGKHAAGYHDLGVALSEAGFWTIIPSRRGDPQRFAQSRAGVAAQFRDRLPADLLQDEGPNDGFHTHRRHVAELTWLAENLSFIFGPGLDVRRVGIVGKSAGGGVALAAAAELGKRVASVALWGSALKTSQWFAGPKADSFFEEVLSKRGIRYQREAFLQEMCDAIDFVGRVQAPILFGCAMPDPYAPVPPEPDKWTSLSEQVELMNYAIRCRNARVSGLKGAEHSMYKEHPGWHAYISGLIGWFAETMPDGEEAANVSSEPPLDATIPTRRS